MHFQIIMFSNFSGVIPLKGEGYLYISDSSDDVTIPTMQNSLVTVNIVGAILAHFTSAHFLISK